MKKKSLALFLAVTLAATSVESAALTVSAADFSSEPVQISEETEPQAEIMDEPAETVAAESTEEIFTSEAPAETMPETEPVEATETEVLFGSEEADISTEPEEQPTETPEIEMPGTEAPEISEEVEVQEEPQEEEPQPEAEAASEEAEVLFGDGNTAVGEAVADFASRAGGVIPEEGVTPLEVSVDYPVNIVEPGEMVWFSYTPAEAGKYTFSSTSEDRSIDAYLSFYNAQGELLHEDDQGKNSNNDFLLTWDLEAGQTYYYCAKSYYEDNTGSFTVRLEKPRSIEAVQVDNMVANIVIEGFGNLYDSIRNASFTITYTDGSEPYVHTNNGDWNSVVFDPYGNEIVLQCLTAEGETTDYYNPKAGNYQIQLIYEDSVFGTYPIQVVSVEDSSQFGRELNVGENQIDTYDYTNNWNRIFKYTPSETAEYIFVGAGNITVKMRNSNGTLEDVPANGAKCNMEAGNSYYLYFSYGGEYTVNVNKVVAISEITLENTAPDVPEAFGKLGEFAARAAITVTYADGIEPYIYQNYGEYYPSFTDPYGNYIGSQYVNEDESEAVAENPKVGTYQFQLICDGSVLGTYPIQVVSVEDSSRFVGELHDGENQITVYDEETGWRIFKYTPSEDAEYAFAGVGSITVKTRNPESGSLDDVPSTGAKCAMEAGKDYYLTFDAGYGEYTVNVMKAVNISEVSVDTTEAQTEFLAVIESYSPQGVKLNVSYEDGSSETLIFDEYSSDVTSSKGNTFSYRIYQGDTEFDMFANLSAGEYVVKFTCDGEVLPGASYTVTFGEGENLRFLQEGINSQVESPDNTRAWYRFVPDTNALYKFAPINDISVYKKVAGEEPQHLDSHAAHGMYSLEADTEYLIGLQGKVEIWNPEEEIEDYYNIFDMEIREIPELTSMQAEVYQTEALAGLPYYAGADIFCTYSDGSTEPIVWQIGDSECYDSDKGVTIQAVITGQDGTTYSMGDTLAAGTYSLKYVAGDNIESNSVEFRVETDIANTSLLNGELYTGRNLDLQSPLKGYAYYSYTPDNAGSYEVSANSLVSVIKKTEEGYSEVGSPIQLEKDETCYVQIYRGNWNDYSEVCNVNINIYSPERPEALEWSKKQAREQANAGETSLIPAILSVTHKNGTSEDFCVQYNGEAYDAVEDSDYAEDIYVDVAIKDNATGEIHDIWWFENFELPEGSYSITVNYDGTESSPLELTVRDYEYDEFAKLEEKKQTVPVGWRDHYIFYTFRPEESGTYGLSTNLEKLNTALYVLTEDGDREWVYDYSFSGGNAAYNLEAGKQYVIGLSDQEKDNSQATVTMKKLPEIKELKVNSYSPPNQIYIENLDEPGLAIADVTVYFGDGTSENLTTGYQSGDSSDIYGRDLSRELVKKNEDGKYEEIEWESSYPAGEYAYRIVFAGRQDKAVYIPVKVVALKDADKKVLSETGKISVENYGNRIALQFTAKKAGQYDFYFNVPVDDVNILTEQGESVYSFWEADNHIYAGLEEGTYSICLMVKEYYSVLFAEVSLVNEIEALKAIISKDTYIAGYNNTYTSDLLTELTINGKSYKVQGNEEINGYRLYYRIENGKDEIRFGDPLPVGTWTITPYLKNSISSEQEAVIMEGTPVTVKAVLPDFENLPALTEDWTVLENGENGEAYYKFTAPEKGAYTYKVEGSQNPEDWAYVEFYKTGDNGLGENYFNQIYLDKNETCFIVVRSYGSCKLKMNRLQATDEELITLEDGTDIVVRQTAKEITAEFTPEKSGYYKLNMDIPQGDGAIISIGGEWCGTESIEYLREGKTYHYKLKFEVEIPPAEMIYRLTFNKTDIKAIKDIRLVLNENVPETNSYLELDTLYQKIITYEDNTISEPMSIYSDDDYGNEINFQSHSSSLATDKEIVYEVYFEYKSFGENQWHKTPVQKITRKGLAASTEMELNKTYTAKANETLAFSFIPSETGEYIVSKDDSISGDWWVNAVYCDGPTYEDSIGYLPTYPVGDGAYSLSLEKGKVYEFRVGSNYAAKDSSFTLRRAKQVKDLEVVKAPDNPNCSVDGVNMVSLKGMQVKATYTDGSTETVTYGEADSTGRRLSFSYMKWLDAEHGRVYVEFGDCEAAFDVTSEDIAKAQKLQGTTTLKAVQGDAIPVQYTATDSGRHKIITSGCRVHYEVKDKDGYRYSTNAMSPNEADIVLEKDQTYYFWVTAEEENPTISVSFGDHNWVKDESKSVDPTCEKDGKLVEICQIHKDETRETVLPKLGHDLDKWTTTKNPTCTEDGEQQKACERKGCDYKETEILPKLGHDLGEWTTTKNPTCTEDGEQQKACKRENCDYKETEAIKALGHSLGQWTTTVEPTCTEDGEQQKACEREGCSYKETEVLTALGHNWSEEQRLEPTETTSGKIFKVCQRCQGEEIIKVLPATGVDSVVDSVQDTVDKIPEDIAPDQITEEQKQEIDTAVDSILQVDSEELLKHEDAIETVEKLENLAVKANDKISETVIDSKETGNVSVSGAGLTAAEAAKAAAEGQVLAAKVSVEKSEKSYEEEHGKDAYALSIEMSIVDTKNNNAVVPGMEDIQPKTPIQITLTLPEELRGRELKLVHVSDEGAQSEVPYTPGQDGSTISFAVASLSDFVLVPGKCVGDHSWDEGKVTKEPGCTENGEKEVTCTVCGEKTTVDIDPVGHSFTVETEDKKAPTCTEAGYQVFKCQRCDATGEPQSLEMLGHSWKLIRETKPTCTAEGSRQYTCTRCQGTKTDKIAKDKNAHNYQWKTDRNATCGKDGQRHQECTRCKAWGKKEAIKATGKHRLGSWRITRAATALATGSQERKCTVCGGAKQTQTIAKLTPTITLNVPQKKTLPLALRKSFTVRASKLAKGDSVRSWSSSNKRIVTVTSGGKITAKKTGTATITVRLRSGKSTWFRVKVQKSSVRTTSISGVSRRLTIKKGSRYTLKPVRTPVTSQERITYSTSNKKVATVSSRGVISARAAGRATITVSSGSKRVRISVTVPKVKTTKITGVRTSLTIRKGRVYRLRPKAYPRNTDYKFTYSSSNKRVATVSSKGVITAKKAGRATITVASGSKRVRISVTVPKVKTTRISGLKSSLTIKRGKTYRLKPKAYPSNTDERITYSSSNRGIATVSSKGTITARRKGTVTITVRSGSKYKKIKVRVK